MNEILKIENIHKTYGEHKALHGISMSIPAGCIYGLLGPNGAGKTTLIRIITQIIDADEGNVYINGESLNSEHIKLIGYLPEERGLYKKMMVGEQLIYLARLKGLVKEEAAEKVNDWLERLEMTSWFNKKIEDLSKGMQQKVQFIAAVVHDPSIIILDEPFSGFDPINAAAITKEILRLKETGSTIIFSTHRMETVEELCDYVTLISKSRKVMDGSMEEINRTYSTNTFIVKHKGDLLHTSSLYKIVSQTFSGNNQYKSEIEITSDLNRNEILEELMKYTEIISIAEMVPDLRDIFIRLVNESNYA
jgi:ABC-2 type transport system ATP-binding protein